MYTSVSERMWSDCGLRPHPPAVAAPWPPADPSLDACYAVTLGARCSVLDTLPSAAAANLHSWSSRRSTDPAGGIPAPCPEVQDRTPNLTQRRCHGSIISCIFKKLVHVFLLFKKCSVSTLYFPYTFARCPHCDRLRPWPLPEQGSRLGVHEPGGLPPAKRTSASASLGRAVFLPPCPGPWCSRGQRPSGLAQLEVVWTLQGCSFISCLLGFSPPSWCLHRVVPC